MLGISVVAPLICIKTNTAEGPPNGIGTKETDIVLPTPPPPPPPPREWYWEQGKMTFCSTFGIKPTMKQVFPVRAS